MQQIIVDDEFEFEQLIEILLKNGYQLTVKAEISTDQDYKSINRYAVNFEKAESYKDILKDMADNTCNKISDLKICELLGVDIDIPFYIGGQYGSNPYCFKRDGSVIYLTDKYNNEVANFIVCGLINGTLKITKPIQM